jgi:hypothetical protein
MRHGLALALAALLCACGSIERRTELATSSPPGQAIIAGPGDTVMDFKATKSLPNAFSKADLFGRTTDAGRIVVRYVGTENGNAVFVRSDIIVESNKTTMTETPLVTANTSTTNTCQSAPKFDPRSAFNFDLLERRVRTVALAPSELVRVAETARARVVG